jgi:alkyl sulfatase BDS1-like metallo-beta-lactamase superfamily hydrolase
LGLKHRLARVTVQLKISTFRSACGGLRHATTAIDMWLALTPQEFLEHAVAENVSTGRAMTRRAGNTDGPAPARGPEGEVGAILGQATAVVSRSLIAPTEAIEGTGDTRWVRS